MSNRWNNIKWELAEWMRGRYGGDALTKNLLWVSIVMWMLSALLGRSPWRMLPLTLGWTALAFSTFRMFSRNLYARQRELARYQRITKKPRDFFKLLKNKWRDRKTHKYFRCSCGAVLRVPKGRGDIVITCPKCKDKISKKT